MSATSNQFSRDEEAGEGRGEGGRFGGSLGGGQEHVGQNRFSPATRGMARLVCSAVGTNEFGCGLKNLSTIPFEPEALVTKLSNERASRQASKAWGTLFLALATSSRGGSQALRRLGRFVLLPGTGGHVRPEDPRSHNPTSASHRIPSCLLWVPISTRQGTLICRTVQTGNETAQQAR